MGVPSNNRIREWVAISAVGALLMTVQGVFMRCPVMACTLLSSVFLIVTVWAVNVKRSWSLPLICLLVVFPFLLPWMGGAGSLVRMCLVLFYLQLILLTVDRGRPVRRDIQQLMTMLTVYVGIFLLLEFFPAVWLSIIRYTVWVTHAVSSRLSVAARLGPTATGFYFWLYALIVLWVRWRDGGSTRNDLKRLLIGTVILVVAFHLLWIPFVLLARWVTSWRVHSNTSWSYHGKHAITMLDLLSLLYIAMTGLLYTVAFRFKACPAQEEQPQGKLLAAKITAFLITVLMAGGMFTAFQMMPGTYSGDVLLYQGGMTSWTRPNMHQLGKADPSGLFYSLPDYLSGLGFSVRTCEEGDELFAEGALPDVLVLINFNDDLSEEQMTIIRSYVKNGGTLLLFADHTNMSDLMKRSNEVLNNVPILVNFDSAHFLRQYWDDAFCQQVHPINHVNRERPELGVSVGASLAAHGVSVIPMLTARYGFSDDGDWANDKTQNYIGDRKYQGAEQLGDLLLAACVSSGRGKVIVYGDTSLLQRGTLAESYEYVADLFRWAVHGDCSSRMIRLILCLVWLAAVLAVVFCLRVRGLVLWIAPGLFVGVVLGAFVIHGVNDRPFLPANMVYLDYAHVPMFEKGDLAPKGDMFLRRNLLRAGLLPMVFTDFDEKAVRQAACVLIPAPARSFSRSERRVLEKYMQAGGRVIVTVSADNRLAVDSLLMPYGVRVGPRPLGAASGSNNTAGLSFHCAYPLADSRPEGGAVLCRAFDEYPVILCKAVGNGDLTVIGDTGFLLNGRLESEKKAYRENIIFLNDVLLRKPRSLLNSTRGKDALPLTEPDLAGGAEQ